MCAHEIAAHFIEMKSERHFRKKPAEMKENEGKSVYEVVIRVQVQIGLRKRP